MQGRGEAVTTRGGAKQTHNVRHITSNRPSKDIFVGLNRIGSPALREFQLYGRSQRSPPLGK